MHCSPRRSNAGSTPQVANAEQCRHSKDILPHATRGKSDELVPIAPTADFCSAPLMESGCGKCRRAPRRRGTASPSRTSLGSFIPTRHASPCATPREGSRCRPRTSLRSLARRSRRSGTAPGRSACGSTASRRWPRSTSRSHGRSSELADEIAPELPGQTRLAHDREAQLRAGARKVVRPRLINHGGSF